MTARDLIIYDTHRGLRYEDGRLTEVLGAGRHTLPRPRLFGRTPRVEIRLVDVRERDLTIKGQEILTADKVALRVSILVQFRVTDPRAALHEVANYEDRLYSDVQLAARRSLAAMTLEEILTNRNRLSEEIRHEVRESASGYGVTVLRADVKDLIFPGNIQEIMNRVLVAERTSQAALVDARTRAESQRIDAQAKAEVQRIQAETDAANQRLAAETAAQAKKLETDAEVEALRAQEQAAPAYTNHPALLRLRELEALRDLGRTANARIYIGFDKHAPHGDSDDPVTR